MPGECEYCGAQYHNGTVRIGDEAWQYANLDANSHRILCAQKIAQIKRDKKAPSKELLAHYDRLSGYRWAMK